ncbi:MAG: type VI secretion system tip protein VgrG [Desulfovibrio sp.]|jgi:type VI secretion system secreted protein VgrG|nr:type VI secretion system tip protein VgrG [Desulfovibrio sp.]
MANNDIWQFSCPALSAEQCRVLAFSGEDKISEGYAFNILLAASGVKPEDARKTQENLLKSSLVTLRGRTKTNAQSFAWNGLLTEVSWLFSAQGGSVFSVLLQPRSARLRLSVHSRIFLSMSLPQICSKLLSHENLSVNSDFSVELKTKYTTRPFTCQYDESAFNFLARHLERAGAYSYIRQTDGGDALVLADAQTSVEALPLRDTLDWTDDKADEALLTFVHTLSAQPDTVTLRDYCTEKPGVTTQTVSDKNGLWGKCEYNLFGGLDLFGELDCFSKDFTPEDASARVKELAEARLRALKSLSDRAKGRSAIPWLRTGYSITLNNEKYQLLSIEHQCAQAGDGIEKNLLEQARQAGFGARFGARAANAGYSNSFVCHPLGTGAYAPLPHTPRPVISGLVSVAVDAGGTGKYAEVDNKGRYKIKFHFAENVIHADSDDTRDGNNSMPLRMMQSHAGSDSGIHFPLLKGVEALAAFVEGDPDRPLLVGALPNPDQPSVVKDENQQSNMIRTPGGHQITLTDTEGMENMTMGTPGGHKIIMHDENGKRHISLESPCGGSYLRIKEQ